LRDFWDPTVRYCLLFYLFFSGLKGFLGASFRVLSILFGPQGILGLQPSGVACPFCLFFFSVLPGFSGGMRRRRMRRRRRRRRKMR
jgi:hypothetical protein